MSERLRVFLVDDHAVFRAGLMAYLEKIDDVEVAGEAGDGEEAIRLLGETRVDVIVLDVSMPGMSGYEAAARILEAVPGTAIVALTMHEDGYCMEKLLGIGVRGFVLKRSAATDLLSAIRAVGGGRSYLDPAMSGFLVRARAGRDAGRGGAGSSKALSPREVEALRLLAKGHTNAEAAGILGISPRTMESHRASIVSKLDLRSRADMVRYATENGLL